MNTGYINETRLVINNCIKKYYSDNSEYYDEVLTFLNEIFEHKATSILKIKIKKIVIDENLLKSYNDIVKKYNLNNDYINIKLFNFDNINNLIFIVKIAKVLVNNLLKKINYKLVEKTINNKKRFKIEILY